MGVHVSDRNSRLAAGSERCSAQIIAGTREYYSGHLDVSLFLTGSVRFHILLPSFIGISIRRSEIEADGH